MQERKRRMGEIHDKMADETRKLLAEKQNAIAATIGRLKVGEKGIFILELSQILHL
jgi:hypothetical protein